MEFPFSSACECVYGFLFYVVIKDTACECVYGFLFYVVIKDTYTVQ